MADMERITAVLDHIKTLPNAVELNLDNNYAVPMWDQRKWIAIPDNTMPEGSCGTAGCFAGWAVMMFVPEFKLDWDDECPNPYREMVDNIIVDGESIPIEEMARQLLGLNGFEADALFDWSNDLEVIENVIDKIGRGVYDPEEGDTEE